MQSKINSFEGFFFTLLEVLGVNKYLGKVLFYVDPENLFLLALDAVFLKHPFKN